MGVLLSAVCASARHVTYLGPKEEDPCVLSFMVSDFVFPALGCRAEQLGRQIGSRGQVPWIFG